jgi:hypothetical protein
MCDKALKVLRVPHVNSFDLQETLNKLIDLLCLQLRHVDPPPGCAFSGGMFIGKESPGRITRPIGFSVVHETLTPRNRHPHVVA